MAEINDQAGSDDMAKPNDMADSNVQAKPNDMADSNDQAGPDDKGAVNPEGTSSDEFAHACISEFSKADKTYMTEALRLAAKGLFTTSPNPNVGCVIVSKNGALVGRGYHAKAGTPHAEVHAIRQAGVKAAGGTAYVTLEPCSHFGRTPPCADALIEAQLARVVVAMQDPYHEVAGRGLAKLREAGIEVQVGLFARQAEALNRGFIKRATEGLPYVRVKLAQSLDGRTALANGQSQWITGEAARHDVQFGRARSSAILSGAGTVLADDPLLNVRLTTIEYREGATLRRALGDSALFAEIEAYLVAGVSGGEAESGAGAASEANPATEANDPSEADNPFEAEAEAGVLAETNVYAEAGVVAHDSGSELLDIRQPIRVIVDNQLQVHEQLKLWQVESPVWLAVPKSLDENKQGAETASGIATHHSAQADDHRDSAALRAQHGSASKRGQHGTGSALNNPSELPAHGEYLMIAAGAKYSHADVNQSPKSSHADVNQSQEASHTDGRQSQEHTNRSRIDLTSLLHELAARGINDIWVEAGANLAGALMTAKLVDELVVYTAPKLMGPDAAGLLNLPIFTSMDEVTTMRFNKVERVGEDIKIVMQVG